MHRRIVITGLGVISAAGAGLDALWTGLTIGPTGLGPAPSELGAVGSHVVGAVRDFSGARYLRNERHARVLNRSFELLVAAGAMAAADAALDATPVPPMRLGTVVGLGALEQLTPDLAAVMRVPMEEASEMSRFVAAARSLHPLRRLRLLPNVGAAILSIEHQAMGPSLTLVSGHATGLQAIASAAAMIRDGRVDAVLAGGADARLTPQGLRQFGALCPISPSREATGACRPFDRARNGVAPGEGAALMLLEAEDSARTRGVEAYAALGGCESAASAEGGCLAAMRRSVLSAGETTADVVIAHGEGGVASDRVEAEALCAIAPGCITSIQPVTGHTMSACGAMNLAAACLILANGCVPAIGALETPEAALPFARQGVRGTFRSVLVNALEPDQAATSAVVTRL